MAYQVLARKWRPKTFADLVGQEHVVKALQNALDKGRLHHAYLLTGTRGVGKTTIARILAKSLNCENPHQGEPCGHCQSCEQIDSGRFVDLLEIDAASNTGIDNIREVLENAQYAPTAGKYKVYIIDEVHMLSKSAFNAMLKTLEEPPEHVKFILATTDPHKVPVTVLSRCLQFVLRNMTPQQVAEHLAHVLQAENIPSEPAALQLLGRAAAGSMRDALSLLDQAIAMGSGQVNEEDVRHMIGAVDKRYLYELLQHTANQNGPALLAKAREMAERAIGFDSALNELAALLQRIALYQTVPSAIPEDDPERETLRSLAQNLSSESVQLYYQCAVHGKRDLALAPDEYAGFVMTLLRMLAFAPLAAKNHPSDAGIEGTGLHTPTIESGPNLKKPSTLPEPNPAESVSGRVSSEQTTGGQPQPESAEAVPPPNAPGETVTAAEANPPIAAETDHAPWEPAPEYGLSENPDNDYDIADYPPEPAEEYFPPADHTDETAGLSETERTEEPEDETEQEDIFIPLPEFAAENWPQLTHRLERQLGAAQMLTRHAAWVSFDEKAQRLTLALSPHLAKEAKSKEFFDKIRNTLAEAYDMPALQLTTCDWQDGCDWETPQMHRIRLQQEGRERAQTLLEADPACQKLMNLLDCREWKTETIELIENIED